MTRYLISTTAAIALAAIAGMIFDSVPIFLVALPPLLLFATLTSALTKGS